MGSEDIVKVSGRERERLIDDLPAASASCLSHHVSQQTHSLMDSPLPVKDLRHKFRLEDRHFCVGSRWCWRWARVWKRRENQSWRPSWGCGSGQTVPPTSEASEIEYPASRPEALRDVYLLAILQSESVTVIKPLSSFRNNFTSLRALVGLLLCWGTSFSFVQGDLHIRVYTEDYPMRGLAGWITLGY